VERGAATPGRRRAAAIGRLALGLSLFVVVVWWIGPRWSEVAARAELRAAPLLLALAATALASAVATGRWKLLAEAMGGSALPYPVYFHAFAWTRVLGQLTSTLAMDTLGRGVALRTAGSARGIGHALAPIVIERMLDFGLPVMVLGWALAARGRADAALAGATLGATTLCFAVLAALFLRPLAAVGLRVYAALARRAHREDPPALPGALVRRIVALGLVRFALVVLQFWAIAAACGIAVPALDMTAATSAAQVASLVGLTPGSLGFQEAGWAVGLSLVGLDDPAIVVFVLVQRVVVVAAFALLAALAWPWARRAGLLVRSGSDKNSGG
jgi:uncharacterized membrane protein YbhN (UPF0104 family)